MNWVIGSPNKVVIRRPTSLDGSGRNPTWKGFTISGITFNTKLGIRQHLWYWKKYQFFNHIGHQTPNLFYYKIIWLFKVDPSTLSRINPLHEWFHGLGGASRAVVTLVVLQQVLGDNPYLNPPRAVVWLVSLYTACLWDLSEAFIEQVMKTYHDPINRLWSPSRPI